MRDWGLKTTLLVSVLTVGACGGGGGFDLEGPAAQQLFQQYSGTWELDIRQSENPGRKLEEASQGLRGGEGPGAAGPGAGRGGGGRGGRGGGIPGAGAGRPGGGGGGFPGGGGGGFPGSGGARGGPDGGQPPSPEAMQMGMALARDVATTLELRVNSVSVRVTPSGGAAYELDSNGEVSEQEFSDGSALERRVRWEENQLTIQQEISGFSVDDHYEVTADGSEMIVVRTIELPRRSAVEVRLVYTRAAS